MGLAGFARIHRESDRKDREKQQQRSERCHCCPASTPQKSEVADRVPDPGSGRLSATHQPTVQLKAARGKPLGTGNFPPQLPNSSPRLVRHFPGTSEISSRQLTLFISTQL